MKGVSYPQMGIPPSRYPRMGIPHPLLPVYAWLWPCCVLLILADINIAKFLFTFPLEIRFHFLAPRIFVPFSLLGKNGREFCFLFLLRKNCREFWSLFSEVNGVVPNFSSFYKGEKKTTWFASHPVPNFSDFYKGEKKTTWFLVILLSFNWIHLAYLNLAFLALLYSALFFYGNFQKCVMFMWTYFETLLNFISKQLLLQSRPVKLHVRMCVSVQVFVWVCECKCSSVCMGVCVGKWVCMCKGVCVWFKD